jgi:hypothetical protein
MRHYLERDIVQRFAQAQYTSEDKEVELAEGIKKADDQVVSFCHLQCV